MNNTNVRRKLIFALSLVLGLSLSSCGVVGVVPKPNRRAEVDTRAVTSDRLLRFANMEEFEAYRAEVRELGKKHEAPWFVDIPPRSRQRLFAQSGDGLCDPAVQECGHEKELENIVVTGSMVSRSKTSITNNQDAAVDEGDIVKLSGRFLVVLQDGRLFSVDTSAGLALVDRINLYGDGKDDAWYDELLVHDNTLVVTAYSYENDSSEYTVVSIDDAGVFKILARYQIESDDYFSSSNYASRLVDRRLLFYTPVSIFNYGSDKGLKVPRIRRLSAAGVADDWKPLFDIRDVYRPIQQTLWPSLHVITICPIEDDGSLVCQSRGIVAPSGRELYVSGKNAYLWVISDISDWAYEATGFDYCRKDVDLSSYPVLSSAAYRFPIDGRDVQAVHTHGIPFDQFAFEERDGQLNALLVRAPLGCYIEDRMPMQFTTIPQSRFGDTPGRLRRHEYFDLPEAPQRELQSRYTKDYVVYGSPQGNYQAYWYGNDPYRAGELVAVPLRNPGLPTVVKLPHSADRVESFGDNAVIFGYSPDFSMAVSTVSLRYRPHAVDTKSMGDLVESEGRSHAFNYIIDDNGAGTFGLPTVVTRRKERRASHYKEESSDVQFFSADRGLRIKPLGFLGGIPDNADDYECEVSCYDWYGNARPIFLDGRAFALTGTELIEGEVHDDAIVEVDRLRITASPKYSRAQGIEENR